MSAHNAPLPLTPTAASLLDEYVDAPKVRAQYEFSDRENLNLPYALNDPIGDEPHTVTKGLVHRYKNRVLFKITDQCAAYCRFCFRKDMLNNGEGVLTQTDIQKAIQYITDHTEIEEVIFSGGDPLLLSNRRITDILENIASIVHVQKIRFHTRMPLIKPSRIDDELCGILQSLKQELRIVLHINHADELNQSRLQAIEKLSSSNAVLLAQSVLLKGINDTTEDLDGLFSALHSAGITPYYLHHLDKAIGTDHFRISIERGQELMKQVIKLERPYAPPDYVIDIPGGFGKRSLLSPSNMVRLNHNHYEITDANNQNHSYIDEAA